MHTPGPWIIPDWKQLGRIEVIGSKEVVVAAVYLQPDPISVKGWPTEEANARLIAAAPELLEALTMLMQEPLGDFIYDVRDSEMQGWDGPRVANWSKAIMKATAAIAKATVRA